MRFTGVNSFVLACKELEKAGLIPAFKYSEARQYFKNIKTPIANLEAGFYYDDYQDVLNIIFYDNNGKEILILELFKEE